MPLLEAYGVSENVIPMALNNLNERRAGSVGKPLASNELTINGEGTIEVSGPGVCEQYLNGVPTIDAAGRYDTGRYWVFRQ